MEPSPSGCKIRDAKDEEPSGCKTRETGNANEQIAYAFFNKKDSSHGLAKRVILFRYLQRRFAPLLQTKRASTQSRRTFFTYVDAFAGAGMYKDKDNNTEAVFPKNPGNVPVNPAYGSPIIALHALYTIFLALNHFEERFVKVSFCFEEAKGKNFKKLYENVKSYCEGKNMKVVLLERPETPRSKFIIGTLLFQNSKLEICIEIICSKFCDFDFSRYQDCVPMFSFIDPFGFSHTSMNNILKLMGPGKEIFFNFMVESVHRFCGKREVQETFNCFMGGPGWRERLPSDFQTLGVPDKMVAYMDAYKAQLGMHYSNTFGGTLKMSAFSMRRGTVNGADKRFIYYLLHAVDDLRSVANMKYAMHAASQEITKLFFADFQFMIDDEGFWRPISDNYVEAKIIYQHWKGKRCTFGQLKEWILLQSPFQIHSKSLKLLERQGKLTVEDTSYQLAQGQGLPSVTTVDKRPKGCFYPYVGKENDDPDPDGGGKIHQYRNAWKLSFEIKPPTEEMRALDSCIGKESDNSDLADRGDGPRYHSTYNLHSLEVKRPTEEKRATISWIGKESDDSDPADKEDDPRYHSAWKLRSFQGKRPTEEKRALGSWIGKESDYSDPADREDSPQYHSAWKLRSFGGTRPTEEKRALGSWIGKESDYSDPADREDSPRYHSAWKLRSFGGTRPTEEKRALGSWIGKESDYSDPADRRDGPRYYSAYTPCSFDVKRPTEERRALGSWVGKESDDSDPADRGDDPRYHSAFNLRSFEVKRPTEENRALVSCIEKESDDLDPADRGDVPLYNNARKLRSFKVKRLIEKIRKLGLSGDDDCLYYSSDSDDYSSDSDSYSSDSDCDDADD